jgi:hypothetical protein
MEVALLYRALVAQTLLVRPCIEFQEPGELCWAVKCDLMCLMGVALLYRGLVAQTLQVKPLNLQRLDVCATSAVQHNLLSCARHVWQYGGLGV